MAILKVANIHFDVAGTTRLQANGANVLTIVTGNTEDARFDASGNLLIGRIDSTVGLGVKLDVAGTINASSVLVNGVSILATSNSYTQTVGTAGNTYAQTVGTAGNNYTITVGAAANGWANTISATRSTASNAYTVTVGTAANGWANTISATRSTASNAYTVTVGTAGNAYTQNVGTSGNVYTREVGTAGNNYTITVGAAANGWANTISATRSTASNTYADTVGTAANGWANTISATRSTASNAYATSVGTAGNNYTVTVGAAANGWSNTKLSNTSGISFNGNLTVPGEFTVGGNLIFDSTTATRIWEPAANTLAIITTQTERARIDSSGNVLIGRTDSTVGLGVKLDVNGSINCSNIFVNGNVVSGGGSVTVTTDSVNATRYIVFDDATSGTLSLANVSTSLTFNPSTGTLSSTLFNSTSDINKKTDIRQITDAVTLVNSLNGVRFDWKNNGLPSLGVIAQDVEKVLPELVSDEKSVNYNGLIAVLIEAVKDLSKRVEELENR